MPFPMSREQRQKYMQAEMENPSTFSQMPPKILTGLREYVMDGRPPGDFLRGVLDNDLKEAVFRADDENLLALPSIVRFCSTHWPAQGWGSREKVKEWLTTIWRERERADLAIHGSQED